MFESLFHIFFISFMSISYKAQNFQHSMLSIKSRGKAEKGLLSSDKIQQGISDPASIQV
jgi:hypothetical protein